MEFNRKDFIATFIVAVFLMMTNCNGSPAVDNLIGTMASAGTDPPIIIPAEDDITLEVGQNFTLKCRSKYPVTWRIPDIHSIIQYEIEPFNKPESDLPHGSYLNLINVQVENVGRYYCIKTEFNNTMDSDLHVVLPLRIAETIYVYVNDPDKLLVPADVAIMAMQYGDAIIPCKPSSKEVKVELLREDESPLDISYRYDPTIGYIAKMIHLTDGGTFICRPITDITQTIYIEVRVHGSHTDFINRPVITSETKGHAIKGKKLVLECLVDIRPSVTFSINWVLPPASTAEREGRVDKTKTTKEMNPNTTELEIGRNQLIIRDVNEKDGGYYSCEVMDHSGNKNKENISVKILDRDENYIEMFEPSNHYTIEISIRKRRVKMLVKYKAFPVPTFTWYNKKGEEIKPIPDRYIITITSDSVLLEIRNIELADTGDYILRAKNDGAEKELKFQLFVKDKPTVEMVDTHYVRVGQDVNLTCTCAGYPKSDIRWAWKPCEIRPKWPNCSEPDKPFEFQEVLVPEDVEQVEELQVNTYHTFENSILIQKSELRFTPQKPGIVTCLANNTEGNDTTQSEILLGDLNEPFLIFGVDEEHAIAAGDEVHLICGVLAYNYSGDIDWYRNDKLLKSAPDVVINNTQSEYSYKNELTLKNISYDRSGTYECRAGLIDDQAGPESRFIDIHVHEPKAPVITLSNLVGSNINTKLGDALYLECLFDGIPEPRIIWYKDNIELEFGKNDSQIFLMNSGQTLKIPFMKPEHEGTYKCVVANRLGWVERFAPVVISNLPGLNKLAIVGIIALLIILILLIIYLCFRFFREKKLRMELKAAGLANFEDGAVECINPALSLDEQADLLPYDRRFEFSREKLKLGKQLGAGAFGVVLKAVAEGITPDEKDTTVAVKMVKKTADNEVMRALVSELKIMVHLGQHLNVVNLLGAVTKNIAKREVMIIVEYCRYGNVQNFLLKNRKNFINQIDPKTGQIDQTVLTKEARFSGDYDYNRKSHGDASNNYIRQSDVYYTGENVNSATTDMTTIPGEEGIILSNNSIQPAWRSNYKPDGSTNMDITTTHLVAWAFQVARGMDYLASRKVLHGDLAARNILLCDDNVVKICDFGLARSMYRSDNYKKHGEAPLPIKWLALESMSDQIFSTYSDIWSYGIVLWEFFSLAKVPYPGMDADEGLYLKLKDGYRMEKPEYANREIYDIMLECWSTNPEMRPAFNDLERRFAKMLEDDVTNHYIDLNDPYLRMNSEYFKDGKTDYLALMGCPEEIAPQAPRYVNGKLISDMVANSSTDPNYVQMQPAIFSPRPADNYVRNEHFTFPPPISPTISNNLDSPSSKNRKKGVIPEEVPMLNRNTAASAGSDSETELTPNPVSSPSKQQFASLNKTPETSFISGGSSGSAGVGGGGDNYKNVNMTDANKLRTKDAFSNPEYLMLNNVNEKRK